MGILEDFLKEIPLSAVVKERLEMAKDELEKIKSENEKLKAENTELKRKKSELAQQIMGNEQFIESHGVLFKKKVDGNFEACAFCPKCKLSMTDFPPKSNENLICTSCNYITSFRPNDLNRIRSNAVREYFERQRRNQQSS